MKYIRTYYENKKIVLRMLGCHHCPMMKFDKVKRICSCKYYGSNGSNVIKSNIMVFSPHGGKVFEMVNIPDWCHLPSSMTDIMKNRQTYRMLKSGIQVTSLDNTPCEKEFVDAFEIYIDPSKFECEYLSYKSNLPSIIDKDKNKSDIKVDKYIDNLIKYTFPNKDSEGKETEEESSVPAAPAAPAETPKYENCSLCGEEDESVDRTKNYGMCDDCWETSENDNDVKKQAFINNFRIKRKVKVDKETQFKLIVDLILK